MARVLKTTSVTFTMGRDDDPKYKLTRHLINVSPTATDADVIEVGEAYAELIAGDKLAGIVLTQQYTVAGA